MVQQMQSQCDDCGGSGDFIREKDRCKKCKGKRLLERDHKLEVGVYLLYGAFVLCVKPNFGCVFMDILLSLEGGQFILSLNCG